ncbi:hypothetical protein [Campylobacter sp. CCS1377]|uniref:Uncharacterized protein n=1 Tax=Campylobacter sp. CCS1377 TaxID=3158229 RepID=A0AAU7E5G9_9BACT
MIDAKYRTPKYFLKPTYPQNAGEIGYVECYQSWLVYGTLFVNKYVELLHRQLVRKGRARKMSANHPLYKNAYAISYYDIKSPSVRPYDYHSYSDLGLNQFFVGQSPYEWYKGDPSDDNGIYHDTSQIVRKKQAGNDGFDTPIVALRKFSGGNNLILNQDYALKYANEIPQAYFLRDETVLSLIGIEPIYNGKVVMTDIFKFDPMGNGGQDMVTAYSCKMYILDRAKIENGEFIIKDLILPDKDKFQPIPYPPFRPQYYDINNYVNELKRLNPDILIIPNVIHSKVMTDNDPVTYGLKSVYFKSVYDSVVNQSKKGDIFHPFYYDAKKCQVFCTEPVIFGGLTVKDGFFGGVQGSLGFIPLYLNSTNSPIGRKDRWFILWDTYYDLYVEEDKEWYDFFIGAIMVVVVVAVAIWTGYATAGALGNLIGGAVGTILSNLSIVLGYVSGISSGLSMLGVGGEFMQGLAKISSIALSVLSIVTMGLQIKQNIQTAIANQTPIMDELWVGFGETITTETGEEISKFGLNHMFSQTLNLASDVMNLVNHKAPLEINESPAEDDVFFGKEKQEQEVLFKSDVLGQDWYNFETFDILNETKIKKEQLLFVF